MDAIKNVKESRSYGLNRNVMKEKGKRRSLAGLTRDELNRPGGMLLAALLERANSQGHQLAEMANELGVTYAYIAQLRSGARKTERISRQFLSACATYLGVPVIAVKVLAGQVLATDFMGPLGSSRQSLDVALRRISEEPLLGCWMPSTVFQLDENTQYFIVRCAEHALGTQLMPSGSVPSFMQDLLDAALMMQDQGVRELKA